MLRNSFYNRIILFLCVGAFFTGESTSAQSKYDYIWFGGRNSSSATGIEGFMLDFNEGALAVKPVNSALEFDMNNVSMCDEEGNLLFYSNGCAVANANHEIMENGAGINAGDFFEIFWLGDCQYGYPGVQDIMSLPDPKNNQGYYLITKPNLVDEDFNVYKDVFQYSYIDFTLANEMGVVTTKNDTIYSGTEILYGYFSATQRIDGDWWIVQTTDLPTSYIKLLVDSTGISYHSTQFIGPNLDQNASAAGVSAFSPDGSIYAHYNRHDQLNLFDFDTETGTLSNHRNLFVTSPPIFTTIEFSSNGRFLYVATLEAVYQVDLHETDPESQSVLVGTFNGVQNPQNADMFLLRRAPDCRIYIAATSESETYGVINFPNRKGIDCELIQQEIKLPFVTGVVSLPNFPNYRMNEESVCDSTILGFYTYTNEEIKKDLLLYPNPTSDYLSIELGQYVSNGSVTIVDLFGKKVLTENFRGNAIQINVESLSIGTYFLKVNSKADKFKTKKFSIIR